MQTIAAVSPNAAKLITIGTPAYVQNAPFTVGATTTGIGASEQLFNVAPCLITFAEQGINVNPILIQVCFPTCCCLLTQSIHHGLRKGA